MAIRFRASSGEKRVATHAWRTNPVARGAARWTWIYRLCTVESLSGEQAVIRLVGLKSSPRKTVRASELVEIQDAAMARTLPLSV